MKYPAIVIAALAGFVVACGTVEAPVEARAPTTTEAGLPVIPVTLTTARGAHVIHAEVASTAAQQAQGLMFRKALAPDAGMLFPTVPARPASFWMKNTPLPLDIIFIRADGTIARIAERTTPYSLDPIDSGEPVAAVLEIAGGGSRALGLAPDDKVSWQLP